MKLIDKLAKEFAAKQHGIYLKTYKIPGYEKGFRDGFAKAIELAAAQLYTLEQCTFGIEDLGNQEVE